MSERGQEKKMEINYFLIHFGVWRRNILINEKKSHFIIYFTNL